MLGTVRRMVVNHVTGAIAVHLQGGTIVRAQAASRPQAGIERAEFDVASRELHLTLPGGSVLVVEVATGDRDGPTPGRRVVYLDQNHWITLAREARGSHVSDETTRAAARSLMGLAGDRKIVLPLSSAHLVETARKGGRQRRELATTMLELSRGWQMSHPLRVRHEELTGALSRNGTRAGGVITLDPDAMLSAHKQDPRVARLPDLPEALRELRRRITAVSAVYAVFVEDDRHHAPDAREWAAGWAATNERLAHHFRTQGTPREHRRLAAFGRLVADLGDELVYAAVETGVEAQAFAAWLNGDFLETLPRTPMLGRVFEVLHDRVRNADDRWEANDLVDVTFLCCAAGYADVVVGERKCVNYLRRVAGRVTQGARLCRTLPEAVEHLGMSAT